MKFFVMLTLLLTILIGCNDSLDDKNISCEYSACPNQYYCNAEKICVKGIYCNDTTPCGNEEECVNNICEPKAGNCNNNSDCSSGRVCDPEIKLCISEIDPCSDAEILCPDKLCVNEPQTIKKFHCECYPDFVEENGECIHEKKVSCNPENQYMPENAHSITGEVTIHYSDENGWEDAPLCDWECNENYVRVEDSCIHEILTCGNGTFESENDEICDGSADNGLGNYICKSFCTDATLSNDCNGFPTFNAGILSCEPSCLAFNTELCRADKIYDFDADFDDQIKALHVDKENNLYVVAEIKKVIDRETLSDVFLVKYNRNREKIWEKQWGTDKTEIVVAVETDLEGNIFVFGTTQGLFPNSGVVRTPDPLGDIFLTKLDKDGEIKWTKQWGGLDNLDEPVKDEARDIKYVIVDSNPTLNHLLLLGNRYKTSDVSVASNNIFLAKVDPSGRLINNEFKLFGSETTETENYNDSAQKMVLIGDLIYIVGGTTGKIEDDIQQNIGENDIFLLTVNESTLEKVWAKQWGTTALDIAYSITEYNGEIYIGGNTYGELEREQYKGESDVFLLKCSLTTQCNSPTIKQFGTTDNDFLNSILINDMGIHLIGHTAGQIGETVSGNSDFFVINRNHDLTENWIQQWGSTQNDYIYSATMDKNSRIYIGGCYNFDPHTTTTEKSILSSFGITIK
ncbi:hypothetical protein JXR93_07915 [bacterium]|nr:hypothetical protein [bacterium]